MLSSPKSFPNTRWTLIQTLREGSEENARAANETLCRAYWEPLYAAARYEGLSEHDAQDAVQGFFVTLLRRDTFAKADASQGKLRNLLLKAFTNFRLNEWRKDQSVKRGAGAVPISLDDFGSAESRLCKELQDPELSSEKIYAREWARSVLGRSLSALSDLFTKRGQEERFVQLKDCLVQEDDAIRLDALAVSLKMQPGALRTALHRMRAQYRECVEKELAATLDTTDPAVIRQELAEMFQAFN
jgi:DNA-directed RNA polymerase specialized sigma24 family protein